MNLSLERRIQIGFGIAIAIILAVGAAALRSTTSAVESAGWVAHTLEVRAALSATLADLTAAETASRGYVITADERFLAPYDAARADLPTLLARLRSLTADNPVQQQRLDTLDALVPAHLSHLRRLITLRRERGAVAAAAAVAKGEGETLMNAMRQLVARLEDQEDMLRTRRSALMVADARLARLAAWGGTLVAFVLLGIASVLIRRELAARRQAEAALHESERRLAQLLEAIPVGVFVLDARGTPRYANQKAQELLGKGLASGTPLGQLPEVYQVYVPGTNELYPGDRQPIVFALRGERPPPVIMEIRRPDRTVPIEVWAAPVRDSRGEVTHAVAAFGDITERHRAEAALRESEERFRMLVGSVRDYAILMLDPDGRIATWNRGAQQIKGYTAEEIVGRNFSCFYPPEALAAGTPARALRTAAEAGRFEEANWRVRKDGTRFWADVVITALRDERGTLRGFAKVTRDLTERKRAEAELQARSAQLEAANRELEAFSYSVSHDLRAPLRSIDGFSQALEEDYAGHLDPTGRDHLRRVRAATKRMEQLIEDLLQLARVSRAELRSVPVDLSALARSIAAELQQHERSRTVEFIAPERTPVRGDPHLLRVVLENLLGNAWKFTAQRPTPRIEFGAATQDGQPVYFVRDNGAGFDMAYVAKLFGAFQRLHAASEFPGTGVGLATVQRIVRRHGGRVWAEGAVDQGATFYFTLS
ncbi:MAG TPA: CHASE3 domain-containing protein [Gemmatimonadales bacterium]|nr:CHASE3 domain-containing protein [Gemmatimonadales bacterium]